MRYLIAIVCGILLSSCGTTPLLDRQILDHRYDGDATTPASDVRPLTITAIDVGQGDATLIQTPTGETILVDAGPSGAGSGTIIPFLQTAEVSAIDEILITHYHEDHMGGLAEVIAGPDAVMGTSDDIIIYGGFRDRGEPEERPEAPSFDFYEEISAGRRTQAMPGNEILFGDVTIKVVAANGILIDGTVIDLDDDPDENATSIALVVEYRGFKMLIAGDITGGGGSSSHNIPDIETPLASLVGEINVLRVAHHGSDTSTNDAFIGQTSPEVAIISVGDDNDYDHPHTSVVERLLNAGSEVYLTERGSLTEDAPVKVNSDITIEVKANGQYLVR